MNDIASVVICLLLQILRIIHSTSLSHVDDLAFRGLWSLRELRIYSASIKDPPNLMLIRHTIENLYIRNTLIGKIPILYFNGCLKIKTLDLSSNHVTSFPALFHIAATVNEITISENQITALNMSCNSTFPQLRLIKANGNMITTVDWSMIRQMPNLTALHLSENRLHYLPDLIKLDISYREIPSETWVYLSGNPWVCDNRLAWVLQGYEWWGVAKGAVSFPDSSITLYSSDRMCCAFPANWKGTALLDLGE